MRKARKTIGPGGPGAGPQKAASARLSPALDVLGCESVNPTEKARSAKRPRMPKMGRHSSGQARVTIQGKVHYLGPYGSPEAHARYAELVKRWLAGERIADRLPQIGKAMIVQWRDRLERNRRFRLPLFRRAPFRPQKPERSRTCQIARARPHRPTKF